MRSGRRRHRPGVVADGLLPPPPGSHGGAGVRRQQSDAPLQCCQAGVVGRRAEVVRVPHGHGADAVIICAGGILPTPLLQEIGVKIDTHRGQVH